MAESSTGGTTSNDQPRHEQVADDVTAALGRLREAVERLGREIEVNARGEVDRARPELKKTLGDLEGMIDAAAERAKVALGDLGNRLDPDDKQPKS